MIPEILTILAVVAAVTLTLCLGLVIYWNALLRRSLNTSQKRIDEQSGRLGAAREELCAKDEKYARLMDKNMTLKARIEEQDKALAPRTYNAQLRFTDFQQRMSLDPVADRTADVDEMIEAMRTQILNDIVHNAKVEITYDPEFLRHTADLSCLVSPEGIEGSVRGFDVEALYRAADGQPA